MQYVTEHSTQLRTAFFIIGILLFGGLGVLLPFRAFDRRRDGRRWFNNLALAFLSTVAIYLLAPFSLVALATHISQVHPQSWRVGLEVVFLDLVIYWQHFLFHKIGFLWRLHRVHHSDTEFDSTTALRFHCLEIYISFFFKALAIWTVGISAVAVIIFEIVLNFSAMFNHGNFSLPQLLERLRLIVVTPDMHRIHHSIDVRERDSNYGFFLSIWDRIFRTYAASSRYNLKTEKIGTLNFRSPAETSVVQLLKQPFIDP